MTVTVSFAVFTRYIVRVLVLAGPYRHRRRFTRGERAHKNTALRQDGDIIFRHGFGQYFQGYCIFMYISVTV